MAIMTMQNEIEAKLRCTDHEAVAAALAAAGGRFVRNVLQRDGHYDDDSGSLRNAGSTLRVREESSADGDYSNAEITFKGPLAGGAYKSRPEVNVAVKSAADAIVLLGALGYRRRLLVEKRRATWRFEGCEVLLDELPLIGRFVEIEGPDEATVRDVQSKLGLSGYDHVPESYNRLVRNEMWRRGQVANEVTLEAKSE